ncbi:MAG: EAL domain-containing protein [Alphaproteobacteria bacterium]|nr:EAL domain-containing protein [Alphaproteobacteria bacterium]MCD8562673.1 EAL domain-containing protein [Alphaproteobacteria bacterium]
MKKSLPFRWLTSSPTQIWKSRISWRIALSVFLTILTVQAGILNITLQDFETGRLADLRETGRSALVPLIDPTVMDLLASPISDEAANRLMSTTKINGLAVYSSQLDLIKTYGEPIATMLKNQDELTRDYRSSDGNSYEVVFRANDLNRPFIIVARMNSSHIQGEVINYVRQTILVMLLMSAFVTSVLMLALGHWLLEPILFMRNNLVAASKNPEDPEIEDSPYDPSDEIGGAIELAENLINQNAENIKRIKSAAEDKIHKLAYYDTLTGLPNRTLFLQTLGNYTRQNGDKDSNERYAVIALDLDHFKDVNDSMGHNVGDAILRSVGKRLKSALPEHAMVSRSGEDEFAVMTKLDDTYKTARDLAEKLSLVIKEEPFKVFNEQFQIRASIGVSTFPDDGTDPDQVLKNADIALNRAKEEGRDTIKEYSEDFDRAVQARFQLLRDLRDALEHKQLRLFYQPQLDLNTGKVIGAEALIRWWKPDNSKEGGSFISPGEFIPVAEQSGLIVPIGAWVLRQACEDAKRWEDLGINIRTAINVSAAQFAQGDLVEYVAQVIKDTGVEAHKLELEVTESVFMDDIQHTIQTLQSLHALGVELAIDDFGTGYSSLSYLRQFPIDRLKIDQSFIRNALNNPDDASIAKTIVGLGHSLNLKVIAEGVETKEHEEFLLKHDCDEVQGFRYSKPVPNDDLIAFVQNYNGKLSSFDKKS